MAGQCERQVIRGDATAVITHLEQLHATLFNIHLDAFCAGIQAVFQQFLDYRGRAFNYLTGSNLVRQPRAEQLDTRSFTHGCTARAVAGICKRWPTLITSFFSELVLRSTARLT